MGATGRVSRTVLTLATGAPRRCPLVARAHRAADQTPPFPVARLERAMLRPLPFLRNGI